MDATRALGIAIEAEMLTALVTRDELAEQLGVSPDTVGRWLRGENEPTLARMRTIAGLLGVTLQDLLDRADRVTGNATRREAGPTITGDGNVQIAGDIAGDVTIVKGP